MIMLFIYFFPTNKVMDRKGFGKRGGNWILGCLSSFAFAATVYGEPKSLFKGQMDLR